MPPRSLLRSRFTSSNQPHPVARHLSIIVGSLWLHKPHLPLPEGLQVKDIRHLPHLPQSRCSDLLVLVTLDHGRLDGTLLEVAALDPCGLRRPRNPRIRAASAETEVGL